MDCKIVFFKNDEIYKKAKVGFFIQAFFKDNEVEVWVDDLSKTAWQKPLVGVNLATGQLCKTHDVGNPKVKRYSLDEFNKHFYIPKKTL